MLTCWIYAETAVPLGTSPHVLRPTGTPGEQGPRSLSPLDRVCGETLRRCCAVRTGSPLLEEIGALISGRFRGPELNLEIVTPDPVGWEGEGEKEQVA